MTITLTTINESCKDLSDIYQLFQSADLLTSNNSPAEQGVVLTTLANRVAMCWVTLDGITDEVELFKAKGCIALLKQVAQEYPIIMGAVYGLLLTDYEENILSEGAPRVKFLNNLSSLISKARESTTLQDEDDRPIFRE